MPATATSKTGKSAKTFSWQPSRLVVGLFVIAAAALATWFAIWQHVRPHVLAGPEYQLATGDIQITPPPEWIKADVRAEVLRDAGLEESLSILDEGLAPRIAQAFRVHPWVAQVERVTKRHPAGVLVELVYRRPVCMVKVEGGVLPVDEEGVLLPSDDFSKSQARAYPLLVGAQTLPAGPAGTHWGDVVVTRGARLAALLTADWQRLRLVRIAVVDVPSSASERSEPQFELATRAGTPVLWGPAGAHADGKVDKLAVEKLAWLRDYASEHGSLDGADAPQEIDLRDAHRVEVRRRAAIRPLPATDPS